LVHPLEHHVRLVAVRRLHDQAVLELEGFKPGAIVRRLRFGEHAYREVVTVAIEGLHLRLREHLESPASGGRLHTAHTRLSINEKKAAETGVPAANLLLRESLLLVMEGGNPSCSP